MGFAFPYQRVPYLSFPSLKSDLLGSFDAKDDPITVDSLKTCLSPIVPFLVVEPLFFYLPYFPLLAVIILETAAFSNLLKLAFDWRSMPSACNPLAYVCSSSP